MGDKYTHSHSLLCMTHNPSPQPHHSEHTVKEAKLYTDKNGN